MNDLELLGKKCKDIVTDFEGICVGLIEWIYGCRQFVLQAKSTGDQEKGRICSFHASQLDVIGDGITDRIQLPVYDEPRFFGKECVDKVTGVKGMCTGRGIWLFNANQYSLEIQPEDTAKEPRVLWVDEGRLKLSEQPERELDPDEVASLRPGGIMDTAFYPTQSFFVR